MDGLELHVSQRSLDQRWRRVRLVVDEALQVGDAIRDARPGRRHEHGVGWRSAADPVLGAAELAGLLAGSPAVTQQRAVHLPDQAGRYRQSFLDALEPDFQCGHVVGHFPNVVHRHAGCFVELEQQEVGQRRLRAFNL